MSTEPDKASDLKIIDITTARRRVNEYLRRQEERMNFFGSGLPDNEARPVYRLVIVSEQEYDFGWVFQWNSKEYVDSGTVLDSILDNDSLIVDRGDGQIYTTWATDRDQSWESYIEGYRSGVRRHRVTDDASQRGRLA